MKAVVKYDECMHAGGGVYYIIIEGFSELKGAKTFPDYEKNAKQKAQRYANRINKKIKELNIIGQGKIHYNRS